MSQPTFLTMGDEVLDRELADLRRLIDALSRSVAAVVGTPTVISAPVTTIVASGIEVKQTDGLYDNVVTGIEVDQVDIVAADSGALAKLNLASTAVTAGSYTKTSLTVDAKGRITAASSGAADPIAANSAPLDIASAAATGVDTTHYALDDHVHKGVRSVNSNFGDVTITLPITADSAPVDVGSAAVTGTDTTHFANDNHVHKGVHSVAKNGSTQLFGDVTLTGGTNVTLTQSGNDISIAASSSAGTVPITVINLAFNNFSWSVPFALTEWNARIDDRVQFDTTGKTQARISMCLNAAPATNTGDIRAQYWTGAAWAYLDGATGPSVNVGNNGIILSAWVTLVAGAIGDVIYRIVGINGDATAVAFGTVSLQFQ